MSPGSMAATYRVIRSGGGECPREAALQVLEVRGALPRGGKVPEARREHPPGTFLEAPREWESEWRSARAGRVEVELIVGHAEQHARVGPEITELVHLVVPRPLAAEVRACGVRQVEHVGPERLCPRMPVEARAHEAAVRVPAVARVGGRVNGDHRERTRTDALDDLGALGGAPRRLADREQRERPRVADRGRVERAHVIDACRLETTQLGDLRDTHRGSVEDAMDAGGAVAVRRDLRD